MAKIAFADPTPEQDRLILEITKRAEPILKRMGFPRISLEMDILAAMTQMDVDLGRLLAYSEFDFGHDIGGIIDCMDRSTGVLDERFTPRCARRPS